MSKPLSKADFIYEVEHLRSWGMTSPEMAERLGMTLEYFRRRLRRCGITADTPAEAGSRRALRDLAAAGQEFTSDDLPWWCEPDVITGEFQTLVRSGQIVKIGTRSSALHGDRKPIFRAARAGAA